MKNSLMDTSVIILKPSVFRWQWFFCVILFSDINPKTKDITIDIYNYEKTEKGEVAIWSSVISL